MKQLLYILLFLGSTATVFAQGAGTLDATFGKNGQKTTLGNALSFFETIGTEVGKDGKIVYIEDANNSLDTPAYWLKRLLPNGSPDATFGKNGQFRIDFQSIKAVGVISDLKIASDGKILILGGGTADPSATSADAFLLRFNANGTLDNTFGKNGLSLIGSPNITEFGFVLRFQSDGKLLFSQYVEGDGGLKIVRLNSNGTRDNTFGTQGVFSLKPSDLEPDSGSIFDFDLDSQGNIYAYLSYETDGTSTSPLIQASIIKIAPNGVLASNFGTSGVVKVNSIADNQVIASGFALQSNGKIHVAYITRDSNDNEENFVLGYNNNGTLDNTFGTSGKLSVYKNTSTKPIYKELQSIKLMPGNGKLLLNFLGYDDDKEVEFLNVVRYSNTGVLDNTFGKSGEISIANDSLSYYGNKMLVQENNNAIFLLAQGETDEEDDYIHFVKILNPFGVGVQTIEAVSEMNVFPTQINDMINIEFELKKEENLSVDLIDIQGRVIQNFAQNQYFSKGEQLQTYQVPTSLSKGIYFVVLSDEAGAMRSFKVVK